MASAPTAPAAPASVASSLAERLDGYVERAQAAATSFRKLNQEEVDRIVWAMVVAGLRNAVELAQLAMEETGFGVFEDKVCQELHRDRVPLRLPEGQAVRRRDRRGPRARHRVRRRADRRRCSRSRRSPTRRRPSCSRRSWRPRRATRSSSARPRARPAAPNGPSRFSRRPARRRAPARRDPGDPRPHARRLAVPVPPRGRRLHLDDGRSQGGRGRERRRQAVRQRRPRQRAGLRTPQR